MFKEGTRKICKKCGQDRSAISFFSEPSIFIRLPSDDKLSNNLLMPKLLFGPDFSPNWAGIRPHMAERFLTRTTCPFGTP